jgi:putative nucleotidyltransferase with HDIG domain
MKNSIVETDRRWPASPWLQVVATVAAILVLGEPARRTAESWGIAFLFPPAAVYVAAGAGYGRWGVGGVILGSLLSTWGAASTPLGLLLFTVLHAVATALPAWALARPAGGTEQRVLRAVLFGVLGSSLVAALLGSLNLHLLGISTAAGRQLVADILLWVVADLMAALVLGLPLLLWVRPAALLAPGSQQLFNHWMRRPRSQLAVAGLLLAAVALLAVAELGGVGFPQWLAVTLLAPIALAAFEGGVGAALLVNLAAALVYGGYVFVNEPIAGTSLREVVGPVYGVLVFFSCFALVGGLLAGRNRILLERVREQERQLRRSFEHVVASLSAAIEAKDATTDRHLQRVAAHTVEVGRRLGMAEHELDMLRYGALLHDVGKIGVPEAVLSKPGPLDAEEQRLMERHVEIGLQIIASVDLLRDVEPLIRYHQERWDGRTSGVRYRGYHGLAGVEIPLGARILAVIDAFDAMTNDRPYRPARPPAEALAELEREAGKQFDPRVVATFVALVRERGWEDSGELVARSAGADE